MSQWDRVKELTEESANAAGTADEKYTAYMDSMEAATKRLQNAWEGFAQSLEVSPVMKLLTNTAAFFVENADKLKYILTALAAVNSAKIFDFVTSKGETGGIKGLLANIPILGDRMKTNNILESIDRKVGAIQGEVEKDNVTKNGGLLRGIKANIAQYNADRKTVKMASKKISKEIDDNTAFVNFLYDDPEIAKKIAEENAKDIAKSSKTAIAAKEAADRLAADKAMRARAFSKTAAIAGITTAATQLATNKRVSGYGQTVAETAGDKALRTGAATAGAVAGAATAFIPVIGPMIAPIVSSLGSVAGEGLAGLISKWFHKDELQMKQRVVDAKENLQRLDGIKSSLDENSSVMTEETTSSEDFEKLYKYTDDLYEKLFELQHEGDVDIIGAINDAYDVFKGVENITSIRDLCDEINNGNVDQRSMIKKQLELAEAQVNFEELAKSQEEGRSSIVTTLSEGFEFSFKAGNYLSGNSEAATKQNALLEELKGIYGLSNELGGRSTADRPAYYKFELAEELLPEEKIKTIEDVLSIYDKAVETAQVSQNEYKKATKEIKDYIQSIKKALEEEEKLDKELIFSRSNVGFLAANIHDLTTTELKDLTMDGVVGRVVEALEAQDVEVRNAAGYIKDEYQDAIEELIKTDSKFNALQQADTKTLGYLTSAQERFSSMLEEQAELVKEYGKSWDKWYDAAKRGKLSEEIAKIVYAAKPERIEQFANAWNTTREGLEKLTREFPDLTTDIGLMSPSEVREYYSVFTDLFEDLAVDSALTAENFEKLINQYPQLLKYYKNGTLSTELLVKTNEEQMVAYANAMLNVELSNTGIGEDFLTAIKSVSMGEANEEAARFVNLTEESAATILKEIGSVKSLNEVLDKANELRQNGNEDAARSLEELVEQYLNYEKVIEWTNPIYAMAQQGEIDRLTQEIQNLNEQKDALSNVNDERQRELDLIKAKEALENARKEKKRVYRQGKKYALK